MGRPKDENPRTEQISFRVRPEFAARIDASLQRLMKRAPGVAFTRTDAIMNLLERGLQVEEAEEARAAGKAR